ncbi:hypothetical protein Hypma_000007 [Hypsizygus marmoreus]|uniref:Uncharacterized protein n=1 Tax=Hypsizygus marmoreus TaxID=39966 RepID=A0A369KH64_HYPMA|nr:hypothetical protein Hypma_000007 [Hypsizygus marmoreus]
MEYDHFSSEDTVVEEHHSCLKGYRKTGDTSQKPIIINSRKDAHSVLHMARKEQKNCELAVKNATAHLRHAILEAKTARERLITVKQQLVAAELQVGEARLTVKASGFSDMLRPDIQHPRPFGVQCRDEFLIMVQDAGFAVKLD